MAYLFENFGTFFLILNLILVLMLLGLIFISVIFMPHIMSFMVSLILFVARGDKKLNPLIQKNLESHKHRNLKTVMMFSICLSFLIFAGTAFSLMSEVIKKQLDMVLGSDVTIFTLNSDELNTYINEVPIVEFLTEQNKIDGCIQDYSFTTPSLRYLLAKIKDDDRRDIIISDTAGYKSFRTNIYGVQENFLNSSMSNYYMLSEV
jgi:hypothetical protein